ncbi:MAG TPA: serine/threonine-protein kinase [Mariprofundaceae bacterium]|nr:serine/threonine-protein kinase [Mariprofundaceae bacterium]
MRCTSCGVDNPGEDGFCSNCGAALIDNQSHPLLGHYRLLSKLGEGGMGVVYCAQDEKLGREVAIKVLHPHLLQHENLKDRFRREARMHAKIIHPNIVTLLSLYEDGEHMALVMEMVHGRNLREYLREKKMLDMVDILRISEAVLSGLEAAHKLGVVHRDLKPANVLLANDGSIKLMDFGLAKPKHGDDDLTQSGATVGSFRYMAPEQILNKPVDARTDLYAFGILLYQMSTGRLPFDASGTGGGEFEIMEKQVRVEPEPPKKFNSQLPTTLSNLILDLLAKDMSDRPSNCDAVRQVLMQVGKQQITHSTIIENVSIPSPAEKQDNVAIAKGLIMAVVRKMQRTLGKLKNPATALIKKVATSINFKKMQAPLVWGGVLVVLLLLGWVLTTVIHVAEQQSATNPVVNPQSGAVVAEVAPPPVDAMPASDIKPKPVEPAPTKPVEAAPKPAPKPVAKPKPKPASKPAPKPAASQSKGALPVTYSIPYKVVRSDNSDVDPSKPNEFRGSSRLYFEELRNYRWKETLHTVKSGQIRLYLDKPVKVSTVILHKASIGNLDFRDGEISLEVQNEKGKWYRLFDRKDKDVDSPLTFKVPATFGEVQGARFRFKSAEPITVGPIDLLP